MGSMQGPEKEQITIIKALPTKKALPARRKGLFFV
jgi:hypothetical protein